MKSMAVVVTPHTPFLLHTRAKKTCVKKKAYENVAYLLGKYAFVPKVGDVQEGEDVHYRSEQKFYSVSKAWIKLSSVCKQIFFLYVLNL